MCAACSTLFQQWTGERCAFSVQNIILLSLDSSWILHCMLRYHSCWGAGINTIIFYAPQLFLSLGVRPSACDSFCAQGLQPPRKICKPERLWGHSGHSHPGFNPLLCCLQGNQQDALIATVIVGLCNHFSTYISFWLADKYGRRFLFIE